MRVRLFDILTLIGLIVAVVLAVSCSGPAVIESSRTCSDVGLDNALSEACERWPGSCEVGLRMDFFCVSQAEVESSSACGWGHSDGAVIDHCTMWVGTSLANRGRVYVGPRDTVAEAAYHEAQHWHLWADVETLACASHNTSCGWED